MAMARQRRPHSVEHCPSKNSNKEPAAVNEKRPEKWPLWQIIAGMVCLLVAGSVGYMGYLETRVNTPFDDNKMVLKSGLDVPDRYWGSYRPGVYFGLKTRDPYSLVTGLMWYSPKQLSSDGGGLRHWCEQSDNLARYGWTEHDGRKFGVQEIQDGPILFTTSFVKQQGGNHGGDWTARISATSQQEGEQISLLLYTAIEDKTKGSIRPTNTGSRKLVGVSGETEGLGKFSLRVLNQKGTVEHSSYLSTVAQGLHVLKDTVVSSLRLVSDKKGHRHIVLPGEMLPQSESGGKVEPNFIVTQITIQVPFELDLVFESGSFVDRIQTLAGDLYTEELERHRKAFHNRFRETFHLEEKGYKEAEIILARAAFSNLLGGIGYFYGASRVESAHTRGPVPYWKAPLYTAVPSRSFFPRGFLWDEGFHGLLIATWDLDIELDIMCHWFDLMNIEGWIPREQILGQEALSKVPEEFVTQRNSNANPPTFFLTLHFILQNYATKLTEDKSRLAVLDRIFPRLQSWFRWFNVTQIGDLPGSYRWRGRDATTNRELNPKTLTSGLDDYPRASHPNVDERHVDLHCWIALAASTASEIAKLLDREDYGHYAATFEYLSNPTLLDELHWSSKTKTYADFGLHTDAVALKLPPRPPPQHGYHPPQNIEKVRVVLKDPELRFVDSTFGYVNLFPFLLQILPPDSLKLGKVLEDLRKPELLWTAYGLRSLAKTAPLYMKRNTEHDPPYWRGAIWYNINYLAVRALNFYRKHDGPHRDTAATLYTELRNNLVQNALREFQRSGYVWEQYNDKTGHGQGSRPFNGWSSLFVLLMGEIY